MQPSTLSSGFQLRVKVYDVATPDRAAFQDVRINVLRNTNAPQIRSFYSVDIYDTDLVGSMVIMLNATDADNVSTRIWKKIYN